MYSNRQKCFKLKISEVDVGVTYSDDSATGNNDTCRVRHLSLAVARDARVVADVLVPDVADAQLRAVIKDTHCA